MQNSRKPLSSTVYGHQKHIHWLKAVTDNPRIIRQFEIYARYLFSGRPVPSELGKWRQSDEYYNIHHQCDVLSGEYPKVLLQYAKQLMTKKGMVKKENWPTYSNSPDTEVSCDFFRDAQVFGIYATQKNGEKQWVYIPLADVEDYAMEWV